MLLNFWLVNLQFIEIYWDSCLVSWFQAVSNMRHPSHLGWRCYRSQHVTRRRSNWCGARSLMHVICGCRCGHWQYVDLPAKAVTLACKNIFCCIWSIPKGWFLWNYGLGEQTILLIHCWSGYFWNLCLAISFLQGLQDQTCVKTMSTKRLRGLRWSCFKDHVPFVSGFRKVGRFPYPLLI